MFPFSHVNPEPLGRAANQLDRQVDLQLHLLLRHVAVVCHVVGGDFGSCHVGVVDLVEVVNPEAASHVVSGHIHRFVLK